MGTHQLPLFLPPVPRISSIPLHLGTSPGDWQRYGRASLRIYIFRDLPRHGSLSPSDQSEDENDDDKIPPLVGCGCSHGNLISTSLFFFFNVLTVLEASVFMLTNGQVFSLANLIVCQNIIYFCTNISINHIIIHEYVDVYKVIATQYPARAP